MKNNIANKQVNDDAFYDSLSLAAKLSDYLDEFRSEEIHLFAYFASVLYLYKGNTLTDWSYQFIVDEKGYPFSKDLQEAIDKHFSNGYFEWHSLEKCDYISFSARGVQIFNRFKESLKTKGIREKCLAAATSTTILIPYTETINALLQDPEIEKKKKIGQTSLSTSDVYRKFSEISKAVGVPTDDLIIPSVVWINYINEQKLADKGLI